MAEREGGGRAGRDGAAACSSPGLGGPTGVPSALPAGLLLSLLFCLEPDLGRCADCGACAAALSWSVETPIARNVASLGKFGLGGMVGVGAKPFGDTPRRGLLLPAPYRPACIEICDELLLAGIEPSISSLGDVDEPSPSAASLLERNHPSPFLPPLRADAVPDTPAADMMLGGLVLSPLRLRIPPSPPNPPSVDESELVDLLAGPDES